MDREHLTARNTRKDAVAHPVQDRVDRAEEVDVGPVGARVIVERGAEAAVSDVGAGGQAQRLLHPAVDEISLREVVQAPAEILAGGELDQSRRLIEHEVHTALGHGAARLGVQLGEAGDEEVGVGIEQAGLEGGLLCGTVAVPAPRLRGGVLGEQALEESVHRVELLDLGQHLLDVLRAAEHVDQGALLRGGVVLLHQRGGVAELLVRLLLAVQEAAQHVDVAVEALDLGEVQEQGGDLRGRALAVAVDAAVALLDPDQGPRDVEVDQLMALGVQVHALRGDVAGDQHADRRGALLERLHHALLLDVGQAAVEHRDLVVLELQVGEQMLA